ncbi:hypothetical protein CXB51_024940 [Gossypium anomalum]|uniref:Retrotransposon gag domain-containing protein n=1 Tax=Gossypium anomalum TaxID=47600 RepID=A0A8J5YJ50_9ROSI|nr:hypothetical protein CXB51_024940 [Gossypium anomalum]
MDEHTFSFCYRPKKPEEDHVALDTCEKEGALCAIAIAILLLQFCYYNLGRLIFINKNVTRASIDGLDVDDDVEDGDGDEEGFGTFVVRSRPHGSRDERSRPVTSSIRDISLKTLLGCRKKSLNKDNVLRESIEDLRKQSRDFVTMCLTSQRDSVQELLDSQKKKLAKRNDALKAMMKALKEETTATTMALSTRIDKLEGELAFCQAVVGKGVLSAALSNEDVSKPKEFVGTRSAYDVDNFLWRMKNYFYAKGIVDDEGKVNTASMFFTDIALLWWRGRTTDKRQGKTRTWQEFQCELKGQFYPKFAEEEARTKLQRITQWGTIGLKPWVRQEVEQRGVQKLSEAMMVAKSVVKLGLGKDKLGSFQSEERSVRKKDHKGDIVDGNGNDDNGGNEKLRVGKK